MRRHRAGMRVTAISQALATGSPQLSSDSGCGPQSGAKPLKLMTWGPDPSAFMTKTFVGWPGMNWLNTILVPSGE